MKCGTVRNCALKFICGHWSSTDRCGFHGNTSGDHRGIGHLVLAAALAALGRIPEARAAAAQVLAFDPSFTLQLGLMSEALHTRFVAAGRGVALT